MDKSLTEPDETADTTPDLIVCQCCRNTIINGAVKCQYCHSAIAYGPPPNAVWVRFLWVAGLGLALLFLVIPFSVVSFHNTIAANKFFLSPWYIGFAAGIPIALGIWVSRRYKKRRADVIRFYCHR